MDLPQLRAFVILADAKHFGRAAARLHITQPALTKRLQALEAAIGARLFERDRAGVALTSNGQALLTDAIRITREAEAWVTRARNLAEGIEGRLDIGFGLSSVDIAPRLVAAFRRRHPAIAVTLNDFSSAEQITRLRDGRLDLGFVRLPAASPAIASRPVASDRLALAYSPEAIDGRLPTDLDACNAVGFVMLARERGPGLRAQIDRWCDATGVELRITQIADDIQTILALVVAGVGASIVPQQAARLMGGAVGLWPLTGPETEWQIGIACRVGSTNPACRRFLDLIEAGGSHAAAGKARDVTDIQATTVASRGSS
jgi:DNA-binding transcriptional LysR family regulator